MKRLLLLSLVLLTGCAVFRGKGETYPGYTCQKSLTHFYSRCYDRSLTKEDFESKVKTCEKEFSSGVCDKEQADLLWCMGRVEPGTYSQGGAVCSQWFCSGSGSVSDGCSCASFAGDLKKCRMNAGIFDE